MNPNSHSSNYMLNHKRHPKDRNRSNDYSNEYYQSETKKEDLELIAGSDHNKKSDIGKERNRQRHKERERNISRHDHDKLQLKNNYERNENYYRRERKSSNIQQNNEGNLSLNYEYEEIRNSNKRYQVREDYERPNKSKRRNFIDNSDRFTHSFHHSDDYHNERIRDRSYPQLEEDVSSSMRYKNSKKEEYRPRKSEKHQSYKTHQLAEEPSYRNSYSFDRNRARDEEHKYRRDEKSSSKEDKNESVEEKKFNFMIILPKNYFRIIEEDYDYIVSEIKKRTRDLKFFQYDYKISNFSEFILRIGASRISSKVTAIRILSDIFFEAMKQTYHNMSYLKISILVPSRFIIGIEGKNINRIREMTDTRIDVFQNNINNKYRQIEFQGSPENISRAAEKIYKIVNKYYFFDNSNPTPRERRGDNSSSREDDRRMRKYKIDEREEEEHRSKIKRTRVRLGNRNEKKRKRSEEGRKRHRHRNVIHVEDTNPNLEKENTHTQINVRNSSISESNCRIENKEMQIVYKLPQESLSSSVPEHNSENSSQNLNLINIAQSNLIETSSFTNYQITQDTKSSIISMGTNINNNPIHISSENIYASDIQKIETKLAEAENFSEDKKFPLNIVVTNQNLNLLKNMKGNIFIEIENKYRCAISKKVEKLSDNEVNILTFYGTPEQNSLAVYYLQQIMSAKKDARENTKI